MKQTRRYGIYFVLSLMAMAAFLLALLFSPVFANLLDSLLCPGEPRLERLVETPAPEQTAISFQCVGDAGIGQAPDVRIAVLILIAAAFPIGLALLTFSAFLREMVTPAAPVASATASKHLAELSAVVEQMQRNEADVPLSQHVLSLQERLKRLQDAVDSGLITEAEYEAQRRKAVEAYARGE